MGYEQVWDMVRVGWRSLVILTRFETHPLGRNAVAKQQFKLPLSAMISFLILAASTILLVILVSIAAHESRKSAIESASTLFGEISMKIVSQINVTIKSTTTLTDTASLVFGGTSTDGASLFDLQKVKSILDENEQLMSAYVGYSDGSFHQLIAVRDSAYIAKTYQAPPGAAYVYRALTVGEDGRRAQKWRSLDAALTTLAERSDARVEYDPRTRPWYKDAVGKSRTVFSAPYVFSSSRLPGLTCAKLLPDGSGVFGVDVTLTQLGDILARQKVAKHGLAWIVNAEGRLVALPGLAWDRVLGEGLQLPAAADSDNAIVSSVARQGGQGGDAQDNMMTVTVAQEPVLVKMTKIPQDLRLDLTVGVAAPLSDITEYIELMTTKIVVAAAMLLALFAPLAVYLARRTSHAIEGLADEAVKIQHFDFSPSPQVTSSIKEVQILAEACKVMKSTIQSKTESLEQAQTKLEMLVQGGVALSEEKRLDRLVTRIFQNAKELANADGGVLYLKEDDELGVELLSIGSESLVLGGLSANPAPRVKVRPAIMAFLSQDSVLYSACDAFNSKKIIETRDRELSLFPTGLPEEPKDCPIRALMSIPIVTRREEVLGVIQLFNPGNVASGEAENPELLNVSRFMNSLAAQAAVTLDNRNLVDSLSNLFDALIQVIASSIDSKSPYTAGHCTRVPELTKLLAKAAHDVAEGDLRDFRLETDDDWRQLWIAAWLHDCGKVTTPEYVVDKATKLETIYDRIHEVRMRFEVLRRDAELAYYRVLADGKEGQDSLRQELDAELRRLDEDFAFVAKCNLGGEFMSEEAKQRIRDIAKRTWTRNYNDKMGVSDDELRRKSPDAGDETPCVEFLLSDKPEHVIPRHKDYSHLKDANGAPLNIPTNEYNRGEIYNLCIPRGTLTSEERFKINEHTLNGFEMLKKIPFPKGMTRVPEIANSHHETLVGTGYPLALHKEQLSVEARILAIADIFEALTASDRPYKKAKKLSEALKIMTFMSKDQHIDPELFDVFLVSGVFRCYAEAHLQPWQNDVEDVSPYLSSKL